MSAPQSTVVIIDGQEFTLVAPVNACPCCGECDIDRLIWDEEGMDVTCQSCQCKYDPRRRD